jgi:hypothetical protein
MRNRRLIVAMALGVLALLAVGAFALWWPQSKTASPIAGENFARIHMRMSRAEVEAVFGPPGDYRTRPAAKRTQLAFECWSSPPGWNETSVWIADTAEIKVYYAGDLGVENATGFALEPETNFFVIARWRANRKWREWFP